MEDSKIIELYFERSEDAITETDRKYGSSCRRLTFVILGSTQDSEECVNDTYLRLWNAIPPKNPSPLGAFVMKTARNLAINMREKLSADKRGGGYGSVSYEEISECLPSPESVESTVDRKAVLSAVGRFLSAQSRDKQIMFVKRYFYCSTYSEIADELHTTEGRVKTSLHRVREKLREFLEKEGIGI